MQTVREVFPKTLGKSAIPVAIMLPFSILFILSVIGQFILAYAEGDAPSLGLQLVQLVTLIKDKASAAVIVVCVFQILRTNEVIGVLGKIGLQGKGLQVTIAILTALGYVANAYATSGNIGAALVEGLFTAGGAMLIFNSFKATAEQIAEQKGEAVIASLAVKKAGSLKA